MKHASLSLLVVFSVFICLCGCHQAEPAPSPQDEPEPVAGEPAEDPVGPVTVKGMAAEKTDNPSLSAAQIKMGAKLAAKIVAYRDLYEKVKGLRLDSETIVKDFVTESDEIRTYAGGYLRKIGAMSEPVEEEDGLWAVTIELTAEEVRDLLEAINAGRNR